MGIKGLWTVIAPYSEKISLHEIRGQTVAVDLAGWVCDSQNVTDYYQPKLYLRNLFFRTIYLLLADINPIFVLEGDAPDLKRDVMAARNAIQFRGAAPKAKSDKTKQPDVARRRFKNVLKECETLLKSMGVRCVKGRGEAEATCARLNAKGLVHAVVSQDSDCFAYGAKIVYRNFSVSSAAGGGAMQGSIDLYDANKMFHNIGFGRKKMVALALLCGCDYGTGACGTSITTVVNFLHTVSEDLIISRLLSWVSDPQHYEEQTRWVSVPGRCDRCGHAGRTHLKNGCPTCVTHRGCTDTGHKLEKSCKTYFLCKEVSEGKVKVWIPCTTIEFRTHLGSVLMNSGMTESFINLTCKVSEVKRELSLRSRALSCGMPFPEPKVMKEFLDSAPEDIDLDSLKIPAPSLIQFVKIMSYKLDWSQKYCVQKFLPLLTKWHLQENVPCRTIRPVEIRKKRNPKGIPSFEVLWGDLDGQYENLIPDDQFEDEDVSEPWITTERQDLMLQYFPDIVEKYTESIRKPPKEKKTRGRKKKENTDSKQEKPKRKYNKKPKLITDFLSDLNRSMNNLSISKKESLNSSKVSVSVNKLKRNLKSNAKGKTKNTIENYMIHKKRKSILIRPNNSKMSIDFKLDNFVASDKENLNSNKHLLSLLDTSVEEANLSDIVEKVISRPETVTTAKVDSNFVKLIFENELKRKSILTHRFDKQNCSTPISSPIRKIPRRSQYSRRSDSKVNTSYFFDKLTDERDAFEISMDLDLSKDHRFNNAEF